MALSFSAQGGDALEGRLKYLTSEHSFNYEVQNRSELTERVGAEGVTSLVIDTLQLEIGIESAEVLFVWGYFPRGSWTSTKLLPPKFSAGRVFVTPDEQLESGVSVPVSDATWRIDHDPDSGWVNLRARDDVNAQFIQIADGVVLGVDEGDLISIWLKPTFST